MKNVQIDEVAHSISNKYIEIKLPLLTIVLNFYILNFWHSEEIIEITGLGQVRVK